MPGCGHNCVNETITKTAGPLSPVRLGECDTVYAPSARAAGAGVTQSVSCPCAVSGSLPGHYRSLMMSSVLPRTLWETEHCHCQGCTLWLHSDTTQPTFLAFLLGVGPSGDSGSGGRPDSGPGCRSYSQNDVNTDKRDSGEGGQAWYPGDGASVRVLTQSGGMWDWQHTRPDTLPPHHTSHPARATHHWENRGCWPALGQQWAAQNWFHRLVMTGHVLAGCRASLGGAGVGYGAGWGAVLCVISSGDPGLGCVTLTPRTRGSEGCERILVLSSLIMLSKCSVDDVRDEVKCLHSSLQRCPSLDTSASVTTQAKTLSLFLCTVWTEHVTGVNAIICHTLTAPVSPHCTKINPDS